MSSICLCMIVKNESHIVKTTLEMLTKNFRFDYWVICDTGSTDDTKDIIREFFASKHINGELHDDPWKDFGTNRSKVLELAYKKTDYALMFDADDTIEGTFQLPNPLTADMYGFLFFSSDSSSAYHRHVLFSNKKRWRYVGVLHEYLECMEPTQTREMIVGNYKFISQRLGDRSKNPDKYKKDAAILKAAYEEATLKNDPIRNRYAFYCANSYKDCGAHQEAIEWYKRVLTLDNWNQEKYVSCLRIYEMYDALKTPEHGVYALVESLRYDKERVECIYILIVYYLLKGLHDIAFKYYECIQESYESKYPMKSFSEKLFVNHEIHNFLFPYHIIILVDRVKQYTSGIAMYRLIFRNKHVPQNHWFLGNLFNNLQYFVKHIRPSDANTFAEDLRNYLDLCKKANYTPTGQQEAIFKQIYDLTSPPVDTVVVAILAKDKGYCLHFYLQCILNQTFPKKQIHLYIRTNDNNDTTAEILAQFVDKHRDQYLSVYMDTSSVKPSLKAYKEHEWNAERFRVLGAIRKESVKYAAERGAHYFVVDVDNFIVPTVLETMVQQKSFGVIAPMLECHRNSALHLYSNFHADIDDNGYYINNPNYNLIHSRTIKGILEVPVVHCTYFIRKDLLDAAVYDDASNRYEYVIFSDSLRKKGIPQYIDNRVWYGFLTIAESPQEYVTTLESWKDSMRYF